ncbi:MAG: MATE family efflux transporter [Alphaproteobacteria bacterium]|nr:MATE family efflux transporter [Alphaproteobacteria bacterium]
MAIRNEAVTREPIGHKRVWALAGPVMLSNVSIPLLGAVDTAVMGHLPDPAYIGGVAIGALIFSYIYWGFGFLRMGTTGFTAQAFGAQDADEIRAVLGRAVLLALGLSAMLLALQAPLGWIAFAVLEASADVESLAAQYFRIRIWSAPATLITYATVGWLFGLQRMMVAVLLTVVMNGLNIALDLYFVIGLGWGIEGVAYATLIAEWSAAGLGAVVLIRQLGKVGGRWRWAPIADRGRLFGLVRVNFDIFIRTLCLLSAFAVFTAQGARLGDVVLAGNAILMQFQAFTAYALDGFAHAAEALVGRSIGARDRRELRHVVRISSLWAGIFAGLFAAVYLLAGDIIIGLLTSIAEVRATAAAYLPWVIVMPLLSVWSFQLDGIFIGATRGPEMRNGMLLSFGGFLLGVWTLLPLWGNHGLWLALALFMCLRGITLGLWYPRVERAAA